MRNVSEEKATLLIVEDDVDVADMLKAYFLVQGYDVLVANWGEDAVRLSSEQKIDLALLDIVCRYGWFLKLPTACVCRQTILKFPSYSLRAS